MLTRSLRSRMRLVINLQDVLHRKLRVPLSGRETLMPQQFLDSTQICPFFQHVRAKRMA